MPIDFLIDENMPKAVSRAIARHNARGLHRIESIQVGDHDAPAKGTLDRPLLLWIEEHGRILVSYDKRSLPIHFAEHLASGRHVPGIFLFRNSQNFGYIADFLAAVAHASSPEEWTDRIFYVD